MSKNNNGLFVNTAYLRDHVYKLQEQRKIASELYEHILFMRNHCDPEVAYQYDVLLRDVSRLIEYFTKMPRLLADIDDDVVRLGRKLSNSIQNDMDQLHRKISNTFML